MSSSGGPERRKIPDLAWLVEKTMAFPQGPTQSIPLFLVDLCIEQSQSLVTIGKKNAISQWNYRPMESTTQSLVGQ